MALSRIFAPLASVFSSVYAPFRLLARDSGVLLQGVPELLRQTRINMKDLHGANLRLAKEHYFRGEYDDAWLRTRIALLFKPQSVEGWYWFGCCYRALGSNQKALVQWQRVLSKQPDNLSAQYEMAKIVAPAQLVEIPSAWLTEKAALQAKAKVEDAWLSSNHAWPQAIDILVRTIPPQHEINTVCEIDAGRARLAPKLRLKSIGRLYYAYCFHELEREEARQAKHQELAVYDQVTAMDDLSPAPAFDLIISATHFLHAANPSFALKKLSARLANNGFIAAITCEPKESSEKATSFPPANWVASSVCAGAHLNTSWDVFGHESKLLEASSSSASLRLTAKLPLAEPAGAIYFLSVWQKI